MGKIRLGVNIDHAATLRQVRGGTTSYPDLLRIAELAIAGGADQITIHLREDRRHIQDADLRLLAKKLKVPLNLEMACSAEILALALKAKPSWACFVPEKREELTTEGGLDVIKQQAKIKGQVKALAKKGIKSSMFIEPSLSQVKAAFQVGAQAVEFHTGKWVRLSGQAKSREWQRLEKAALQAHQLGLGVHAGHGLDFSTAQEIRDLPYLEEVNIGHSLICYSLEMGIRKAVQSMRKILV